ncbi:MAG: hypothetical protein PHW76_07915, partial [Alphaproteobacteria bacterium]|nr:hypothetical protein [Alphaproteobacteria bacterium]
MREFVARRFTRTASHESSRFGFGVAPVLYMLGLIGVGAGVLFSSYSQSLKNNIVLSNTIAVRNDLEAATNTFAAISVLSQDGTKLCPPGFPSSVSSVSDGVCIPADTPSPPESAPLVPVDLDPLGAATISKLPSPPDGQSSLETFLKGSEDVDVGIIRPNAGAKQIDPWGHYYIVCRWVSPTNNGPAFQILSAGPSGKLDVNSYCGNNPSATAGNFSKLTDAANATNRASIWQTSVGTTGTMSASYSATGVVVDSEGNLTVPGNLNLTGVDKNVTLTSADLSLISGDLGLGSGNITLTSGNLTLVSGSATIGTSSITNGGDILARSASLSGAFSAANGAASGPFAIDALGNFSLGPSGASVFSVAADTGNASVAGAVSVGSTVTIGTISGTAVDSLNTFGAVHIATTVLSSSLSIPYLSVGTPSSGSPVVYLFSVDQAGNVKATTVTANLYGALNATSINDSGTLTVIGSSSLGILSAGDSTFGNITATSYGAVNASSIVDSGDAIISGNLTVMGTINGIPGGGADLSNSIGVVPIEHGGTGYSASNTLDGLLTYLGVRDAGNLTFGTLPLARLPIVYPSGDPSGTYNTIQVDQYGRVIGISNTYMDSLTDADADSIALAGHVITVTIDGVIKGVWDTNGLTIGSNSAARGTLDLGRTTDALVVPVGTTGDQPSTPTPGMLRYNTTKGAFEGYIGSAWQSFAWGLGSQWISSGSSIYYMDGNVGIGTTNPVQTLQINGPVMVGAGSCGATTAGSIQYNVSGDMQYCNGSGWVTFASGSGGGNIIGSGTPNHIAKFTSANTLGDSAIYEDSGNVGIGTTSPSSPLAVYGSSGSSPGILNIANTNTTSGNTFNVLAPNLTAGNGVTYNIGVSNSLNNWVTQQFVYNGSGSTSNAFSIGFNSQATPALVLYASNNVYVPGRLGIGTTGPSQPLHVAATGDYAANILIENTNKTTAQGAQI